MPSNTRQALTQGVLRRRRLGAAAHP
jgi:hypothetical protein